MNRIADLTAPRAGRVIGMAKAPVYLLATKLFKNRGTIRLDRGTAVGPKAKVWSIRAAQALYLR